MSQRRSALGRGLGALISNPANRGEAPHTRRGETPPGVDTQTRHSASEAPTADDTQPSSAKDGRPDGAPTSPQKTAGAASDEPKQIPIALIDPNPEQPRREFDSAALQRLAASIGQHGVLQPVVVRREGDRYELIMGERRFRASQLAGRSSIPAVVTEVDTADRLELAIVENVQRQDLNPIELALAYQALSDAGHTQEEIGRKVAMDRSSVANHLRLLDLSRGIQSDLEASRISMGHAKALLGVPDLEAREALHGQILRQGLSVRATEKAARELAGPSRRAHRTPPPPPRGAVELDPDTRAYVERIERHLQTRVTLHPSADGSGKVEIRYFNLEDLERLGGLLLGESA